MKLTLLAPTLLATLATADFVIVTIPLPAVNPFNNFGSQVASFSSAILSRVNDLTASLPASELARGISANSALQQFVKTASVSVDPKVTQLGAFERLSETPTWYTVLPSDLRAYYDGNNAKVQSAINEVAGRTPSMTGPSQTGSAAGAKGTGSANAEKVMGYMGVGAAAAFGAFVL
jgi:hypothetical protein